MQIERKNTLFIFRRDLRLDDNNGLISALEKSKTVIPIFILDDNILLRKNQNFFSLQFMIESLNDLRLQLEKRNTKLFVFKGHPSEIVHSLLNNKLLSLNQIIVNRDYTPYSLKRDKRILQICKKSGARFSQVSDLLLNEPEIIHKNSGKPYVVFTPFYRTSSQIEVPKPENNILSNYFTTELKGTISKESLDELIGKKNKQIYIEGGRAKALQILRNLHKHQNYELDRDFPAKKEGTTLLSAHLKFGTVSIREVYYSLKEAKIDSLIRQLYWRDFYTHIGYHFPHVFVRAFQTKYNNNNLWRYDEITKNLFQKWCEGKTGFPIVDAGMRQLNQTGFMHNRVRMIVASFLTKDLHIDWRWGERYFAQKLIDFDLSVNNGNWQWAASTGCDAVPYFRIFNPWTQQKKFDPQCVYIKTYIPELRPFDPKIIHNLEKIFPENLLNYPPPIVDHSRERNVAISLFKDDTRL